MLDFTSALYLGFRHAHHTLQPWTQLTTGRPAALETAPQAERVAQQLALLLRCERAALAPSTLHLFWDLFDVLANESIAIYADAGAYPIARWGIERAAAKGVRTVKFPTHDAATLKLLLQPDRETRFRPVVVTDGLCPATGRVAPLADYLKLVREQNGYLVIDDTQALGILGSDPGPKFPYGRGGAGTPAWRGVEGPELIIGSSLAKGFGAPLAVLAGNARMITKFNDLSATRVHSSPPSLAAISAAQRALVINAQQGDRLRNHLATNTRRFREGLHRIGLCALGGLFPAQTLAAFPGVDPKRLHRQLLSLGVKTVLRSARNIFGAAVTFLITASHARVDIDRCLEVLEYALAPARFRSGKETTDRMVRT